MPFNFCYGVWNGDGCEGGATIEHKVSNTRNRTMYCDGGYRIAITERIVSNACNGIWDCDGGE